MLANSVIIVLREVIEAALLIGLLSGFSRQRNLSYSWLFWGALIGLVLASLYAGFINTITDWFDGVGQEVLNGCLLFLVYGLLLLISVLIARCKHSRYKKSLNVFMCLGVALILAHEGSELMLFWYGFFYMPQQAASVLIGSLIGLGIGFSVGFLFYVLIIVRLAERSMVYLQWLLGVVAAGLCIQATQFFIQADWLAASQPLWDSSKWLAETSVLGQLSYSLFGYEATPSLVQMLVYGISLSVIVIVPTVLERIND